MFTAVLITLALGITGHQTPAAATRESAERLAQEGRSREALVQFEQILAREPGDPEVRIWTARLCRRLGQTERAAREYRVALALAPGHVDALVGLSTLLASRGAMREASELLDRAERIAPSSSDVLAARAFVSRMAGRSSEAERYYARASAISPSDGEIRRAFEHTRRLNRHRVEGGFQHEALSGAGSAHVADIGMDLRRDDGLRFNLRFQAQSRASRSEARAGGGFEWRARPDVTVRATALVSPGANVIPRFDTSGEVEHSRAPFEFGSGVRAVSFDGAGVWMLSPFVAYWVNDRTSVSARYYASWTTFPARDADLTHSAMVRFRYALTPRLWIDSAYSRGYESLDTLSIDRLASLRADTVSGGILYHLRSLQSLAAGLDYQRRSDDRTLVRVTLAAVHRF